MCVYARMDDHFRAVFIRTPIGGHEKPSSRKALGSDAGLNLRVRGRGQRRIEQINTYIYRFDRVYISNQEDRRSHVASIIFNNSIKSRTDLEGTKEDSLYPSNYGKDGIDPR